MSSKNTAQSYLYYAILIGLVFHATALFFTFEQTYDGYVHMFFGDHYARDWFENWEFRWYTGFTVTSYPPLVHQVIALLSYVVGLKFAFLIWSWVVIIFFIRGVYVFSNIWVSPKAASWAAVLAIFCPSFVEALHIFGQLPSLTGISFLLNATPLVYLFLRKGKFIHYIGAMAFLAMTSSAHHVTTIFGMVFFILPVMGVAVIDNAQQVSGQNEVQWKSFIQSVWRALPKAIFFGLSVIVLVVILVLPYWLWSSSDPITQIPIPHGSRDNFIDVFSSGLVFFLIPWGMILFSLPFILRQAVKKRNIFLGLALIIGLILGTGGTTPIPRLLLGETAFNILTLDRFTFWASLLSMPFWGMFIYELIAGDFKKTIIRKWGNSIYLGIRAAFVLGILLTTALIINLGYFRPLQPKTIDIKPITNFLERDGHDQWRYLTLGFGDQMAWLSANTSAMTVDGNYHSVRRLPEFTTRAVERLENAKYRGVEGLGALHDFLTLPNKYHLKYIFSNDNFYEPVLYFTGWNRVQQLENNIVVWEYPDVKNIPKVLYKKSLPYYQRLMWGVLPLASLSFGLLFFFLWSRDDRVKRKKDLKSKKVRWTWHLLWAASLFIAIAFLSVKGIIKNGSHQSPENIIETYYDALDFKHFEKAYDCFNEETKPSFEQYNLELSLDGGILNSFAKLDNIDIELKPGDEKDQMKAKVTTEWVTSVMTYKNEEYLILNKKNKKWFIAYPEYEKSTAADRYLVRPELSFHKQGKRKAKAGDTFLEDVLDRPEVGIGQCHLVKNQDQYSIVGRAYNLDAAPAHISLNVQNRSEQELIDENGVGEVINHRLLPKESTLFRIDFDSITSGDFSINLLVSSTVTDNIGYRDYQCNFQEVTNDLILKGELINTGTKAIHIPQVIIGQYNAEGILTWVEEKYLVNGIRPQKSQSFDLPVTDPKKVVILRSLNAKEILINGKINKTLDLPKSTIFDHVLIEVNTFTSEASD